MTVHQPASLADIDVAAPELYERAGIPHALFTQLRSEAPVHWNRWDNRRGGFWSVTAYDDLVAVTRDRERFTSEQHTNLFDLSPEAQDIRRSLIETDGPAHVRLRRLVTPPFTSRRVVSYEESTRQILTDLLDAALAERDVDLVTAISEPYPIQVIVSILGIDRADGDLLVELSSQLVEGTSDRILDPAAYGNTTPLELLPFNSPAAHALFEFGREIGRRRAAEPADDLVSRLIAPDPSGDRLTDAEFCNFFQLLVFAGNETTRTATTNGLLAFMEHPDQLERLKADPSLIPQAVEEILRWSTPVLHMRRTALVDTELRGVPISAGDWVVLWYASANFDGDVFSDPLRFDIGRPVQPSHVAFGAFGSHHCLGAPLARLELRILLEEIVRRDLVLAQTGAPVRVRSNFVNGVLSLPCSITSARR